MLTDTHVHLDQSEYAADLPQVLARSREAGVTRWIVPAIASVQWALLPELHQQHNGLFYALGLHPWFLLAEEEAALVQLERWLASAPPGLVAIGECGLDARIEVPMDLQLRFLQAQLELARAFNLPLILHSRGTHNELLALLTRYHLPAGGVIHAFSGSLTQAGQFWKLGFYLGVGGAITYERAAKTRRAFAAMPREALLLETDGPTMPLAGYQGQRNEPGKVAQVLATLAELRGEPATQLADQIERNVERLFYKIK